MVSAKPFDKKTGMQLSPYFPAAKYAWLQENEPEVARAKQENRLCLGTIDSWLVYKLTKGETFATDVSNASRTQLFNITDLKWDEEICGWFSVDAKTLPEVRDSNAFMARRTLKDFFLRSRSRFWERSVIRREPYMGRIVGKRDW